MEIPVNASIIDNAFIGLKFRIQHKQDDLFNVVAKFMFRSYIEVYNVDHAEKCRYTTWTFQTDTGVKIELTALNIAKFKLTKI